MPPPPPTHTRPPPLRHRRVPWSCGRPCRCAGDGVGGGWGGGSATAALQRNVALTRRTLPACRLGGLGARRAACRRHHSRPRTHAPRFGSCWWAGAPGSGHHCLTLVPLPDTCTDPHRPTHTDPHRPTVHTVTLAPTHGCTHAHMHTHVTHMHARAHMHTAQHTNTHMLTHMHTGRDPLRRWALWSWRGAGA